MEKTSAISHNVYTTKYIANTFMITDCYLQKGIGKNGNEYYRLVLIFKNGYKFTAFLNNEQVFILKSVVPEKAS